MFGSLYLNTFMICTLQLFHLLEQQQTMSHLLLEVPLKTGGASKFPSELLVSHMVSNMHQKIPGFRLSADSSWPRSTISHFPQFNKGDNSPWLAGYAVRLIWVAPNKPNFTTLSSCPFVAFLFGEPLGKVLEILKTCSWPGATPS